MEKKSFHTPILFIIFNRPNETLKVFERIKHIAPTQLFIAADGPRQGNADDVDACQQARAVVHLIDWPCEVKIWFRDNNLGCGRGVSAAISWFFESVEAGIILEDDCVPDESFFFFCQVMLQRYRYDEKVAMISGTNVVAADKKHAEKRYSFTRFFDIWGWATWRRAWQGYDFGMHEWPSVEAKKLLYALGLPQEVTLFWERNFNQVALQGLDTWDYQWTYACLIRKQVSVVPLVNLISNIGFFGAHANGTRSVFHEIDVHAIDYKNLIEPALIVPDMRLELALFKKIGAIQQQSFKGFVHLMVNKLRGVFHS